MIKIQRVIVELFRYIMARTRYFLIKWILHCYFIETTTTRSCFI